MNVEQSTSHSLIERVKQNDAEAWQHFAHLYGPVVYAWIRRAGLDENNAADVCQNVFQALLKSIMRFEYRTPASRFRGWLRVVTQNEVRQFWRRQASQPMLIPEAQLNEQPEESSAELFQEETAEERRTTDLEICHRAMQLIQTEFESATWTAFWRTVVDSRPAPEIAADLGISPGAVRQAKYRVLCRLRQLLAEELPALSALTQFTEKSER